MLSTWAFGIPYLGISIGMDMVVYGRGSLLEGKGEGGSSGMWIDIWKDGCVEEQAQQVEQSDESVQVYSAITQGWKEIREVSVS